MDPIYWTDTTKLRANYEEWCKANGYTPKGGNSFTDSLQAHELEATKPKQVRSDTTQKRKSARGYQGVRLINAEDAPPILTTALQLGCLQQLAVVDTLSFRSTSR